MNPLEYITALETKQLETILSDNSKEQYTKDEVIKILKDIGTEYRKAIYNGEYIFDIETLNKQDIKIKDREFSVQKLITHDDKYLLFLQITDIDNTLDELDIETMAAEINEAMKKTTNVAGVIILPPNTDISLISAKLDYKVKQTNLKFNDEDFDILDEWVSAYKPTYTTMNSTGGSIGITSYTDYNNTSYIKHYV